LRRTARDQARPLIDVKGMTADRAYGSSLRRPFGMVAGNSVSELTRPP